MRDFRPRSSGSPASATRWSREAPSIDAVRDELREALRGRAIVAHNAEFERHFLGRWIARTLGAIYLDTQTCSPSRIPMRRTCASNPSRARCRQRGAPPRARRRGRHAAGDGSHRLRRSSRRAAYAAARSALANYAPDSPWLALLDSESDARNAPEARAFVENRRERRAVVEFDEVSIAAALRDAERRERHFPGYRVREAQWNWRCASRACSSTVAACSSKADGRREVARLSGPAAIPFAMREAERAREAACARARRDLDAHQAAPGSTSLEGHPRRGAFLAIPRCVRSRSRAVRTTPASVASPVLAEARETQLFPEQRTPMRCSPRARRSARTANWVRCPRRGCDATRRCSICCAARCGARGTVHA